MIDQRAGALDDVAPYPIPAGRGRWRLTVHRREFLSPVYDAGAGMQLPAPAGWSATFLGELENARGRRLELEMSGKGASLSFTLDGHDPAALLCTELNTDIYAWRWDDWRGRDVCMFRGVITHAEDQLTEQSHTVSYGARDYLAMLERRHLAATNSYNNGTPTPNTQDLTVANLVWNYGRASGGPSGSLAPGYFLPLAVGMVNPDGTNRSAQGPRRDRIWEPGNEIFQMISDLSEVINGFDYDVLPAPEVPAGMIPPLSLYAIPPNTDVIRVWYPQQGVTRADVVLVYGGNVASLTRTVSSADYANRVWGIGKKADTYAPQMYSDAIDSSASGTVGGAWMDVLNLPDVSQQSTLDEQTNGQLHWKSTLVPSYTVTLRPGSYRLGYPNMGDVVGLVVQSGRLDVHTDLRVVGISYDVGEDGDETVELTVGRRPPTFAGIFRDTKKTLDALTRK